MSSYIGEIRIGKDYQATLPSYLGPYPSVTATGSVSCDHQPEVDHLGDASNNNLTNCPPLAPPEHGAVMVWNPKSITDDNLIMFLRAARSVTAFAGMCRKKGPNKEDGASVVSRDDTTQRYFDVLHENEYDVNQTLDILGKDPLPKMWEKEWTHEEAKCFSRAIKIIGKEFHRVRDEYLKHKRTKDLIQFYYFWKKSPYNPSRNQRRNRRNRKCGTTNPPTCSNSNGVSSNNNTSKSGSNSKGGTAPRPPNPSVDQVKVEDGGAVSTNKASETLTIDSSLPSTTTSAPSPGRVNGQDHEPAKSSALTTAEDTDNIFDNDDIPLLNLVKVARGLASAGPATNPNTEPSKDKSGSGAAKEFAPKEVVENNTMDTGPLDIKIESSIIGGTSMDPILPEAIVLDEGIAAPRITLATTSTTNSSSCNNLGLDLYEIPLSDIGTIKSELMPVQSSLEAKLDEAEKSYEDLPKSPVPLKIVGSHGLNFSEANVKSSPGSPVQNRTSSPEPFLPVRSSLLIPTPPGLIKTLKLDVNESAEQSADSSLEISEAEMATANAQLEAEQWLGEKLFRNGNMYRNIKRADGLSCARTDMAFVYQRLPFHYPADGESSQLDDGPTTQTDTMQIAATTSTTHHAITGTNASTASTTSTPIGPFAAKMNRSSKAPAAVASIIPIPCPPKSRPSREDECNDRGHGLGRVMGGLFAPHHPTPSAPSYWYGQSQQPFLLTPPPLHLAQASAALLPYFMAAASGAFAPPPFSLPPPLVPLNFEPEGMAGNKASTPVFAKGLVARGGDHQQQKNQRAQESSHDYTRSSAVKNGFNAETTSPGLFRGSFSSTDPFEPPSPYYPYFSSQQPQQRPSKSSAMGLVKSVASPPQHPPYPYPPHSSGYSHPRAGTHKSITKVPHSLGASGPAGFTPWANRPAPHPGVYEYPPGSVKDLSNPVVGSKRKSAQDSTLERKKTPVLDAKTAPSRKQTANPTAYFPKFPASYNELAFNHSLGMGSNQDISGHISLPAHHPNLTNGAGLSGKTPPGGIRSKMVTSASTGNAPFTSHALLDPFYHHHRTVAQQQQARLPGGPFEFNPFLAGPASSMVSSSGSGPGSNNPYHHHHLSHQNYHPSLMRAFRGANFNPFPPLPEEIMAAAAAQHQYQLLQQHSYFPNPFSPNLLPSVLQQQDRADMKRE